MSIQDFITTWILTDLNGTGLEFLIPLFSAWFGIVVLNLGLLMPFALVINLLRK